MGSTVAGPARPFIGSRQGTSLDRYAPWLDNRVGELSQWVDAGKADTRRGPNDETMELTPDLLLRAYAVGIFPMAESRRDHEIHWIDPEVRGVIPLENFHVPRRLRRTVRKRAFEVTADRAFRQVIAACAQPSETRPDTWINPTIERLYRDLHQLGFGHSVECWQDGELVGGLYGVALGGAFFGESMFSRVTDASKVALVHLVARLEIGGFKLFDTQFTTPHLNQFGAVDIRREQYRQLLSDAVPTAAEFQCQIAPGQLHAFLQNHGRATTPDDPAGTGGDAAAEA